MSNEFRMPSLGPDMESGTLVEWRVKPGDIVRRGDVVALVETDKGVIDVEIFSSGVIESLLAPPGARVPVGTVLARLAGEPQESSAPAPPAAVAAAAPPVAALAPGAGERRISPAARARARALRIDPASVAGTGPGGVVTLADVLKQASAGGAAPAAPDAAQPHDMRRVIAKAMSRSKREIPHYYLSLTCSFLKARTWIDQYNAGVGVEQRLLPAALLVKAVALAARAAPDFNGFYKNDAFSPADEVNVGVAIAMRGGRLVAPAILETDRKALAAVMSELRDLTARVRAGRMRGSELARPTITLTSLGEDEVDLVIPVIYPPQVAIVGCGAIVARPWIVEGRVAPAPLVSLCVAADHRVTDGRTGARFLAHIRDLLQTPEAL